MQGWGETARAGAARDRRVLEVVCAWCRALLGVRPAGPTTAGAVSHGLCAACARRLHSPRQL